jgi:hypothetical protein
MIQRIALETVPFVPLGQYLVRTAYRKNVTGVLHGPAVLRGTSARPEALPTNRSYLQAARRAAGSSTGMR